MSRTAQTLLDEAIEICGGQAKLALRIKVEASRISAWRNGLEPMTAEAIGLLCDVVELRAEEARRLAVLQLIERAKPARKEALRRAFFVSLVAGVGLFCGDAATNNSYAKTIVHKTLIDVVYIVRSLLAALAGMARFARRSAGLRLEPLGTGSQPCRAAAAP